MRKLNHPPAVRTIGFLSILLLCLWFGPAMARADVVLDWNEIAIDTFIANQQNPLAQARFAAIAQLAVFEAVNAITGDYQSYFASGRVLGARTIVAPAGASAEAAAAQAAHDVLVTYFPDSAKQLDDALANSLAQIPDGQPKTDGRATGRAAAIAMMTIRAKDGSFPPQFKVPGPPVPGEWQATPSCPIIGGVAVGILYHWQFVTPFGIAKASDYLLQAPPQLATQAYAKSYNEVKAVGSFDSNQRPPDRAQVSIFYAYSSPAFIFNQVARQVAQEQGDSLAQNARALALLNMAISDAAVATFFNKYHYNLWRPETAIHGGDTDGNPDTESDPNYAPFVGAPCFPSYPSNHGTTSGAGAAVLRSLYGEDGHQITLTNPALPDIILHYTAFQQITDDVSDARVYGGIHFRFDQDAGEELGKAVSAEVYGKNLLPAGRKQ